MERLMNRRVVGWLAVGFSCAMSLAGCSKSVERTPLPDQTTARQAIETVLNACKKGQSKPSQLTLDDVKIEIRDAIWNSGEKLNGYEIGSEESQGIARLFTVKLVLPKGERTAKYAVVGKDPIWVYSAEEFGKLSAWGDDPLHPPATPPTRRGRASGGQ
jgi:hypothetical protein